MRMKSNLFLVLLGLITISADTSSLKAQENEWQLVFSDEFNQPNGSQPDPAKWSRHRRGTSTWSRWISDSKDVVYVKNGRLVCRAIPNRSEPADTAKMLTGAINTKGKFSFKYGKVEVRMRTNLQQGNFPAAWMVPQSNVKLPYAEIDIMESFGTKAEATHTIHSQLTQDNKKHGESNFFRIPLNLMKWHVYGVEWDKEKVVWTVDGKTTGVYRKSNRPEKLSKGQWTFDVPFYLILNQSLGRDNSNNSPIVNETYETQFDWIRVYQRVNDIQ